jgi:hypothetical protein
MKQQIQGKIIKGGGCGRGICKSSRGKGANDNVEKPNSFLYGWPSFHYGSKKIA